MDWRKRSTRVAHPRIGLTHSKPIRQQSVLIFDRTDIAARDDVWVGAFGLSLVREIVDAAIKAQIGDSQFGVEELAQALHADRITLFRRIKELYGQSARPPGPGTWRIGT